ncbi:Potassium channel [Entomortierella chlamydospora]|uniref:Potassium channel n=1 Tax=Entomortierella chlamydospora TaxID=101097 RepID=A0A9P6MUM8_9FUNG|nr:Potassium channel [Entomortierella chlamydospora]KAG0014160.1 Potassium channel [Entomortierella chlamydospora]
MLTVDWWRGFPSAGLSATLKALIISSFVMTTVIIIGSAIYTAIEDWTFDQAVNFCIVSFATIGYGNLSPKTSLGQIIFSFYGLVGISAVGFFVVSLRNAVIEQFQWRLVEKFSNPAHLTRVQTRMSAKDISFPEARFEEEQRVKTVVKRRMIIRMGFIWIVMWFGGAGIFCAFESWTFLQSLYFCFVTLTTIGFGDYVPQEPGSIEFWNVYVFIGLSVFAYILSLSSESMAQHIHLVDDCDDDDSMYGWERNEDPSAPLTTRSITLGLEGLKWRQNQQNIQQPNSNMDHQANEEGKMAMTPNGPISNLVPDTAMDNDPQSSVQRNRHRNSSGRILMVSARERKQMLQAEYYAANSPSTTIQFMDTKGMLHQRTYHGGSMNLERQGSEITYGTMGRNGHGPLKRITSLMNPGSPGGVGVGSHGTMYGTGSIQPANTVQTRQLQHQPLIRFDSPSPTVRGSSGHPRDNQASQSEREERNERAKGSIPSCLDLFNQSNHQSSRSEGSPADNNTLIVERPQLSRLRSSSYDNLRPGPSQDEIHRWLAEGAGTLEAPKFIHAYNKALEKELDAEFKPIEGIDSSRKAVKPPFGFSARSDKGENRALLQNEDLINPYEGVAPDVMPIPLTTEPETMNATEEAQFSAGQNTVQIENTSGESSRSQPRNPEPPIHESASPSVFSNEQETAESSSSNKLFLGGGTSAGYGRHGYGVPTSEAEAMPKTDSPTKLKKVNIQPAPPVVSSSSSSSVARPSEAIQLFDSDVDSHQLTIHSSSSSQPLSLFSNHPRSGQSSAVHTPSGSISSTVTPPVLMTIFDVPAWDHKNPQTGSRNSSLSVPNQQSRSRANSNARRIGEISGHQTNDQTEDEAESSHHNQAPSTRSRVSSEISIGPFDETRTPETIPRFDDDVDLNHIDLTPEQIENERKRREDLKRREREIEARLARLGPKGRADYQS